MIVLLLIRTENGVAQRGDRFAFTGYLRGDALIDFRGQAGLDEDGVFRLSEHVDETGRNHFTVCIDGASAGQSAKIADSGNLAGANSDIAGIPGRAGAVDDVAVGDDDIEGRRRRLASLEGGGAEEQDHRKERGLASLKFAVRDPIPAVDHTTS